VLNKCSATRSWLYPLLAAFIATVHFRFPCKWVPPGIDSLVSTSADSRRIKDFQIEPGESLRFLNSLLIFLPGFLSWASAQISSQISPSAPSPVAPTLSHRVVLRCRCPQAQPWSGQLGARPSPVRLIALRTAPLEGKGRDGAGQLFASLHRSVALIYQSS